MGFAFQMKLFEIFELSALAESLLEGLMEIYLFWDQ